MPRLRHSKLSAKDMAKDVLHRQGPVCVRPLTRERLVLRSPTRHSLPTVASASRRVRFNNPLHLPKCVQTTYTLELLPQSNVATIDDLEDAVRAISSPCGNFVWGHSKIVKIADASPETIRTGGANSNSVDVLQIVLIHINANHDGNVRPETIAMFGPTAWEPRDLKVEQTEIISVDQILNTIRGWEGNIKSCIIVNQHEQQHLVMASKGPAFPNGMGNDKRYPPPWHREIWHKRVAERKAKEMAYKSNAARKWSKFETDGQWDDLDDNDIDFDDDDDYHDESFMPDAAFADLDSSESYKSISPSGSTNSEQSRV